MAQDIERLRVERDVAHIAQTASQYQRLKFLFYTPYSQFPEFENQTSIVLQVEFLPAVLFSIFYFVF